MEKKIITIIIIILIFYCISCTTINNSSNINNTSKNNNFHNNTNIEIINDLNDGKSFEELAKSKSSCPSGKKGGNLGWFSHGQMVREFQNAAFKLKKGEVSQPVKTQFGWHVIKCKDSKG